MGAFMDGTRFDDFARLLGRASRRATIRGLLGVAGGVVAPLLVADRAGANHFGCRHLGDPCKHRSQCCSGRCKGPTGKKTCRAHDKGFCRTSDDNCKVTDPDTAPHFHCDDESDLANRCFCWLTTGKVPFCGGSSECGSPCREDAECVADFGPGAACVDASACNCVNETGGGACAAKCPNPA
jgi:hypothetical protein